MSFDPITSCTPRIFGNDSTTSHDAGQSGDPADLNGESLPSRIFRPSGRTIAVVILGLAIAGGGAWFFSRPGKEHAVPAASSVDWKMIEDGPLASEVWTSGPLNNFFTGETPERGGAAPSHLGAINTPFDLSIPDLLTDGKVVVLDFWATWCGNCRVVTAHMNELEQRKGGQIEVLTVTSEDAQTVLDWMTRMQGNVWVPHSIVLTGADGVGKEFGVTSYPTVLVLDPRYLSTGEFQMWHPSQGLGVRAIDRLVKGGLDHVAESSGSAPNVWRYPGSRIGEAAAVDTGTVALRPVELSQFSIEELNKFHAELVSQLTPSGGILGFGLSAAKDLSQDQFEKFRDFYQMNRAGSAALPWLGDEVAREVWVSHAASLFAQLQPVGQRDVLLGDLRQILADDPSPLVRLRVLYTFTNPKSPVFSALNQNQRIAFFSHVIDELRNQPLPAFRGKILKALNKVLWRERSAGTLIESEAQTVAEGLAALVDQVRNPEIKLELVQALFTAERGVEPWPDPSSSLHHISWTEWCEGEGTAEIDAKYQFANEIYVELGNLDKRSFLESAYLFAKKKGLFPRIETRRQNPADRSSLDANGVLGLVEVAKRVSASDWDAADQSVRAEMRSELAAYLKAYFGNDVRVVEYLSGALIDVGVDGLDDDTVSTLREAIKSEYLGKFYPTNPQRLLFHLDTLYPDQKNRP